MSFSLSYWMNQGDPDIVAYFNAGANDAQHGTTANRPNTMGGTQGVNSRRAYDDGYTSVSGVDENSPDSIAYYKAGRTDAQIGNKMNRPDRSGPEWDTRRRMYDRGYADYTAEHAVSTPAPDAHIPTVVTPQVTNPGINISALMAQSQKQTQDFMTNLMAQFTTLAPAKPAPAPVVAIPTVAPQTAGFDFANLRVMGPLILTLVVIGFLYRRGN